RRFLSLVITTMAHAEGQHHPAAGQHDAAGAALHHEVGQQHPLGIYFKIWGLLFVLSTASYLVDYFHFQGYLRWTLILMLKLLKSNLRVPAFPPRRFMCSLRTTLTWIIMSISTASSHS